MDLISEKKKYYRGLKKSRFERQANMNGKGLTIHVLLFTSNVFHFSLTFQLKLYYLKS